MVSKDVAEKVDIERQSKDSESLIAEREFMIYELERLLKQHKGESKRAKKNTIALEGQVKTAAQSRQ